MIKEIVDFMIATGTEQTYEGNWCFYLEELAERFNFYFEWLQDNIDMILEELESRNEVALSDYESDNTISVYYYTNYCKNIEEIKTI